MNRRRRFLMGAGAFAALEGFGLGLGCASDKTTGSFITLETRVGIGGEASFDNAFGFRVTLRRAEVALASLRIIEHHAIARRLPELLVPRAHAHPGHDHGHGHVLAEVTGATVVDLLAADQTLAIHEGVTGEVASVELSFFEASELGGHVARLEGTVVRAAGEVDFVAELKAADLINRDTEAPEIAGCPFSGGPLLDSGIVRGALSLSQWLDQVNFADESLSGQGLLSLIPETPPHNALVRGARHAGAYAFNYWRE